MARTIKETVTKIFKSVELNNLSLYWNSRATTYNEGAKESKYLAMKNTIPTSERRQRHQYCECTLVSQETTDGVSCGKHPPTVDNLVVRLFCPVVQLQPGK